MADPASPLSRFAALLAPQGQELLGLLRRQEGHPAQALRLGTDLRARYPVDLVVDALAQHELRLRARAKFSRAMDMFFTRAGLEQASAEVVAGHRMARYAGAGLVADLCCGIGGDLTALAAGRRALAVDRDPLHLRMAVANAGAYGAAADVTAVAADVRGLRLRGVDAVFIDPARRAGQRRLRAGTATPRWTGAWAWRTPSPGRGSRRRPGSRTTRSPPPGNWSSSPSGES